MNRTLHQCPVCNGRLYPSELACEGCHTTIRSDFEPCAFCSLSAEQLRFALVFLRNRGNGAAAAGELGVSFPTVSRRLDALVAALGEREPAPGSAVAGPSNAERARILDQLDRGEITADEATRRLRGA